MELKKLAKGVVEGILVGLPVGVIGTIIGGIGHHFIGELSAYNVGALFFLAALGLSVLKEVE